MSSSAPTSRSDEDDLSYQSSPDIPQSITNPAEASRPTPSTPAASSANPLLLHIPLTVTRPSGATSSVDLALAFDSSFLSSPPSNLHIMVSRTNRPRSSVSVRQNRTLASLLENSDRQSSVLAMPRGYLSRGAMRVSLPPGAGVPPPGHDNGYVDIAVQGSVAKGGGYEGEEEERHVIPSVDLVNNEFLIDDRNHDDMIEFPPPPAIFYGHGIIPGIEEPLPPVLPEEIRPASLAAAIRFAVLVMVRYLVPWWRVLDMLPLLVRDAALIIACLADIVIISLGLCFVVCRF